MRTLKQSKHVLQTSTNAFNELCPLSDLLEAYLSSVKDVYSNKVVEYLRLLLMGKGEKATVSERSWLPEILVYESDFLMNYRYLYISTL